MALDLKIGAAELSLSVANGVERISGDNNEELTVATVKVDPVTGGINFQINGEFHRFEKRLLSRPTNLQLIEGFPTTGETIATNPSAGGAVTLVSKADNKKIHATRGARILTASGTADLNATVTITGRTFGPITDTTVFCLVVDCTVLNADSVDYISTRISSDGGASKYLQWTVWPNSWKPGVQHLYFTRSKDCSVNAGEVITNTFNYLRILFKNYSGAAASDITILGVYAFEPPKASCVIYCDDAWASIYTEAFPYMQSLGLRGFISVIADKVGETGYCTLAQLHEMRNAGWEMGTHGDFTHTSLGSYAAIVSDVNYNRQYLRDNGLTGAENFYTYPGGAVLAEPNGSISALRDNGFIAARSTFGPLDSIFVGAVPTVDNLYFFTGPGPSESNWGDGTAPLSRLDKAAALGASLHPYFHQITNTVTNGSIQITVPHFQQYMDKIKSLVDAGTMVNLTPMEWYRSIQSV